MQKFGYNIDMEETKVKKSKKSFKVFIIGFLVGLVLAVGACVGIGYSVVQNMTLAKAEKWFNFSVELGSDPSGIKKMKLPDLIAFMESYTSDIESVTLNDIEADFGIRVVDEHNYIYGVDITALLDIPIPQIHDNLHLVLDQVNLNLLDTWGVDLPDDCDIVEALRNESFDQLGDAINNLTIPEIFGSAASSTGLLKLLDQKGATLATINAKLAELLDPETMTFETLYQMTQFDLPDGKQYSDLSPTIRNKTLNQIMSEYITMTEE